MQMFSIWTQALFLRQRISLQDASRIQAITEYELISHARTELTKFLIDIACGGLVRVLTTGPLRRFTGTPCQG
jgi:hypothetical protein